MTGNKLLYIFAPVRYISSLYNTIIELHESGFTEDFQIFGDNLLWIQGNIFLRPSEFHIVEYHRFNENGSVNKHIVVFGIESPHYNVKGILLNHYSCYTTKMPYILENKLGILFKNNHKS